MLTKEHSDRNLLEMYTWTLEVLHPVQLKQRFAVILDRQQVQNLNNLLAWLPKSDTGACNF
jgi:hypothetical protein